MLTEQGPQQPIYLELKCTTDSLILYIYYIQLQRLGVNFGLTRENGEIYFHTNSFTQRLALPQRQK